MINIQDLIPFMRKGWVAMDECCEWIWYSHKPAIRKRRKIFTIGIGTMFPLNCFDIAPADDWTKSLIKVGGK